MSRQSLFTYHSIKKALPSASDEFVKDYSALKADVKSAGDVDLTKIKEDIDTLNSEMNAVESDVSTLKTEMTSVESGVNTLNSEMAAVEADIVSINATTADLQQQIDNLSGGGGVFIPELQKPNQTIATGQTGILVSIGTVGKITKLTYLSTSSSSAQQAGISIEVDGNELTPPSTLTSRSPVASSDIGVFDGSPTSSLVGTISRLTEVTGEIIKIKKDAGLINYSLIYSYVTGVVK